MPVSYETWKRVGFFNQGAMDRPEYAYRVFRKHFDAAGFSKRSPGFVCLELGPGDSVSSALIGLALGASQTYLVDIAPYATHNLSTYRRLANSLVQKGLRIPDISRVMTCSQLLALCSAKYLTQGVASLRAIPSASVDFVFSQVTLQQVRRAELVPVLSQLRRIQKSDGVGSHSVCIRDYIGGATNDLRFSSRAWESPLMANAGFYTNRMRYSEMLRLCRQAGFEPEVTHVRRWNNLPIRREKLAKEFSKLTDDDLRVYEWDLILH